LHELGRHTILEHDLRVDVKEVESTKTSKLVQDVALLAGTGSIAARYRELGKGFLDHGVEDGEEVVSLVTIAAHTRVGDRVEVGSGGVCQLLG
jgi:hypothetical protein